MVLCIQYYWRCYLSVAATEAVRSEATDLYGRELRFCVIVFSITVDFLCLSVAEIEAVWITPTHLYGGELQFYVFSITVDVIFL